MSDVVVAADIEVGHHHKLNIGGVSVHIDTIATTILAGAIVIALGLWLARTVTSGVPSKIQLLWESVVGWVEGEVNNAMGKQSPFVVPLAVGLFFFILMCNWVALLPSHEYLPPATSDVNLTYSMALVVIIWVHINGIRKKGSKAYFSHFVQPYKALMPLNVIEEIVKPFTLALRLFGNIFSGGIMIALIGLMPVYFLPPVFNALWKVFDMGIGLIQAFIFALLTILYFGMASAGHGDHDHDGAEDHGHDAHDPREDADSELAAAH
ncbi:MAG TPA: F0F1 ATP synthase subunit A [Nonomuraea sp.]|nr:F0F1 ATP synthase subunit A [Nonomuraea sp.]